MTTFSSLHPNHCRTCHGWGGQTFPGDWVPYGSTSTQLPSSFEPCPDCLEEYKCPWCGADLKSIPLTIDDGKSPPLTFTKLECTECAWVEGKPGEPISDIEPLDEEPL